MSKNLKEHLQEHNKKDYTTKWLKEQQGKHSVLGIIHEIMKESEKFDKEVIKAYLESPFSDNDLGQGVLRHIYIKEEMKRSRAPVTKTKRDDTPPYVAIDIPLTKKIDVALRYGDIFPNPECKLFALAITGRLEEPTEYSSAKPRSPTTMKWSKEQIKMREAFNPSEKKPTLGLF